MQLLERFKNQTFGDRQSMLTVTELNELAIELMARIKELEACCATMQQGAELYEESLDLDCECDKANPGGHCPSCGKIEKARRKFATNCGKDLLAQHEALNWDIDAYRGALGYSVPGNHTGKLTNGTTPQCGICNSEHRKTVEAQHEAWRKALEYYAGDADGPARTALNLPSNIQDK